jgi:hypothetical protein
VGGRERDGGRDAARAGHPRRLGGGPRGARAGERLLRVLPARRARPEGRRRAQPRRGRVGRARREGPRRGGGGRRGLSAGAGPAGGRAPAPRGREPSVGGGARYAAAGRRDAAPRRRGAGALARRVAYAGGGARRPRRLAGPQGGGGGGEARTPPRPGHPRRRGPRRDRGAPHAGPGARGRGGGGRGRGPDRPLPPRPPPAAPELRRLRGLLRRARQGGLPGGDAVPRRPQLRPVRAGGGPCRPRRPRVAVAHVHRLLRVPPAGRRADEGRGLLHAGRVRLPHGRPQRRVLRPQGARLGRHHRQDRRQPDLDPAGLLRPVQEGAQADRGAGAAVRRLQGEGGRRAGRDRHRQDVGTR